VRLYFSYLGLSMSNKQGNGEKDEKSDPQIELWNVEAHLSALSRDKANVGAELVSAIRDALLFAGMSFNHAVAVLPILAESGSPSAKEQYDQYSGVLVGSTLAIIKHVASLQSATRELIPVLAEIGTLEAEDCRKKLEAAFPPHPS